MNNRTVFLTFLVWLISAGITTVAAATNPSTPLIADHDISQESLENKISALNNKVDLDENLKNKLLGFYHSSDENLRNDQWFQFLATSYQESIAQSPKQIKILQSQIDKIQSQSTKTTEFFNTSSVEQLEQRLAIEKNNLNTLDAQINKIENELKTQDSRPMEIRLETEAAKQALEDDGKNSEIFKLLAETELEREARQLQLKTLHQKLNSQLKMLGVEAISYPARIDLLKKQLQLLNLQKQALLPIISEIEKNLLQRQQLEAQNLKDKLLKVEQNSSNKHPLIQLITKQNINYSLDLQNLSGKMEQNNLEKERLEWQALEVENDFNSAEKKISLAGLSPELGKILREQRYKLATVNQFNQQTKYLQSETAQTSLAEFNVETRTKQLANIDLELQNLIRNHQPESILTKEASQQLEAELRTLLAEQKELLNKLSKAYTSYLRGLSDYDFAKQQLLKQADKYALFLDERLLWVPSSSPIGKAYLVNFYRAGQWLVDLANWKSVSRNLFYSSKEQFFLTFLSLLILGLLSHYKNKFRHQIANWATKVGGIYNDQFYFTVTALSYMVIIVLPLPLAVFFLSYFLETAPELSDFNLAVAKGLQTAAIPLFFLQLFYHLFSPGGIVEKHFNWQTTIVQLLHHQIGWIKQVVIPAIFLMNMANASKNTVYSDSLGRFALIVIMLAMMWVFIKLFHPERGILHGIIQNNPESWLARLRYFWYACAITIPLIVIGFAVTGYYLSALELEQQIVISLRLCFLIIIAHQLVLRWLTLINKQLALTNAKQKRLAAQANIPSGAVSEVDNKAPLILDIPKINQQTKKLLNLGIGMALLIGLWLIWKNILPAFSFLDQIVLWQHFEHVDGQEVLEAITLINFLSAAIYLFVMLIAVSNFPGLLEILILRRFSFDQGSRYAINQLTRYLLITIGVICIANQLGGSWSQVQWLVAALSVGLGFGLQEIFANLVSGIILLFERPIRVGDTVTIGDVSGKVSQIQMRATRIVDWDEKELIVPNKTFITDKLVNWALSSQITRVVIPLTIAYGSDIDLAYKVITETVYGTPLVLAEPKPDVFFLSFGDSALEFSIRVHVNELSHRMLVTHDLHVRLYKALAAHNIEIPFPQQDIHLRSVPDHESLFKPSTPEPLISQNNQ